MFGEVPMARTLYRKILDKHVVRAIDANTVLLYVDLHFANEYTSPQAFAGLVERGVKAPVPDAHLCVVDHIIPSADVTPRVIADAASLRQAETLEANCRRNGIDAFYGANDPHQGIEHVVVAEQGLVRPGMVVICGDSHTTTRGALGHVVEYQGSAVDALSIEGRMTLCNLTVEAGARGALVAPDEKTTAWVEAHAPDLAGEELEAARSFWRTLAPDEGAVYDRTVTIDASSVRPMVTWGTSPDQCTAIDEPIPEPESFADPIARAAARRGLAYQGLEPGMTMEDVPVQHVFIGSCTNARLADLRAAAGILRGRHVAPGVRAQVVPGSMEVRRQAEEEGIAQIFRDAGFEWRKSGCSLCLCMNDDILEAGVRCASTTNRNFEGRQGRGARTHLVSPQMAAAAAVTGRFTDWRRL